MATPANEHEDEAPAAQAPANGTNGGGPAVRGAVRPHRATNPNAAGVAAGVAALAERPLFNQEWADETWAVMAPWVLRGGPGTESNRLEDINITAVKRMPGVEGGELRIGVIRGHHVSGAYGTGVGSDGGPGPSLLRKMADMHMGADGPAYYDLTFSWKSTGHIITKRPMSFPAPRELAGMMRGLGAPPAPPAGSYDSSRGPSLDGPGYQGAPGVGAPPGGYSGPQPQGASQDAVMQMSREMREMQQRHYDEMRMMYAEVGRQPPPPPPGVAAPPPPSPEFLAMKSIVEQQSAMIKQLAEAMPKPPPPPDPKAAFAREVVVEILGALGYKPPPAGVAGVGGLPGLQAQAAPAGPPPKPKTMLEVVNQRVSETNSLLEARDVLNQSLAAIGVQGVPGVPEANAEVVEEEEKPEDALPFRFMEVPSNGIFGQQTFRIPVAKEGESPSALMTAAHLVMNNPGLGSRAVDLGERLVEPLVRIADRLAEMTKPNQAPQAQPNQAHAQVHAGPIPNAAQRVPQGPPPFDVEVPTAGVGAPPAGPTAWGDEE